jgi:glycosyl transferase, family 25
MNDMLGLDHIYVINVRSFEARRRHVTGQLARFQLQGEFIHTWDAEDITDEISERYFSGADLSSGQKSCAMKHIDALEKIVDRNEKAALVVEDDIVLRDDFCEGVRAALAERSQYPSTHVIFIGSGGNFYTPRSQRSPGRRLYPATRGRFGDSYILGSDTAKLRLDWIKSRGVSRPIDNEFQAIDLALDIQMLWLEEPVVEQGSKNGLFRSMLEPAPPPPLQKLKFGWEKFRRKYLYQLWR